MTIAHSTPTTETCGALSSSDHKLVGDPLSLPDETSPLLQPERVDLSQRAHSERWRSAVSAFLDKNAGLLLVAASQFFFAASNISVKWLNSLDEHVPILELIWVRMAMTYICSVAYMYWRKIPDPLLGPKRVRPLLVLRGYTGFIALSGMYFSLQYLSLSDAVVLQFIAPILTGFSGAIFLKETLSVKEIIAGLCSFIGVILIARPQALFGGPQKNPSDVATVLLPDVFLILFRSAAMVGVLGSTGSYTLLRAIGKQAHALHVLSFFSSQCVLVSTIGMIIFKIPPVIPTRGAWLVIMFLIGIFGLIAQTLLAMGFQRETASRGTLALYTSVVFAIVFEFFVFHTTPTLLSITGAIIIMSSAIFTSVVSSLSSRFESC
ncbi:hypothetical protein BJV74DRAFT_779691 [Russula compacta]|nr:hypothetical protein BJV74DRAFT_779691 [Russula compacta]